MAFKAETGLSGAENSVGLVRPLSDLFAGYHRPELIFDGKIPNNPKTEKNCACLFLALPRFSR